MPVVIGLGMDSEWGPGVVSSATAALGAADAGAGVINTV